MLASAVRLAELLKACKMRCSIGCLFPDVSDSVKSDAYRTISVTITKITAETQLCSIAGRDGLARAPLGYGLASSLRFGEHTVGHLLHGDC